MSVAPKQAWQQNDFMIPSGGGPSITPSLNDLDSIRNSTLPQDVPTLLKKDGVLEIKFIGVE